MPTLELGGDGLKQFTDITDCVDVAALVEDRPDGDGLLAQLFEVLDAAFDPFDTGLQVLFLD